MQGRKLNLLRRCKQHGPVVHGPWSGVLWHVSQHWHQRRATRLSKSDKTSEHKLADNLRRALLNPTRSSKPKFNTSIRVYTAVGHVPQR